MNYTDSLIFDPEGPAWCLPLRLDDNHYLFYAYQ